ncbi:MAG: hypothetical protein IAF08_08075 [Rhizobacter sp.]|nr:hypothetical protein [Chlorobiales bacterium]
MTALRRIFSPASRFILTAFLFLPVFFPSVAAAQGIGKWKSYTSILKSSSVVLVDQHTAFVGTEGGLYRLDRRLGGDASAVKVITNSEGLYETRITALRYDSLRGGLWIGFESGAINFYDLAQQTFITYLDLTRVSQYTSKTVRDFFIGTGDAVYVATDFGIALLSPSRREIKESYTALGAFSSGTAVAGVLLTSTRIIAATASGLAIADLSASNLVAPTAWKTVSSAQTGKCNRLALFRDTVFVAAERGLFEVRDVSVLQRSEVAAKNIIGLSSNTGRLSVLAADEIAVISATGVQKFSGGLSQAAAIAADDAGKAVIADKVQSLIEFTGTGFSSFTFNSPASNTFAVISIDAESRLWGSSARGDRGNLGFYRFAGNTWKNFINIVPPQSSPVNQFSSLVALGGETYVSTWGRGLLKFSDADSIQTYNRSNSDFIGFGGDVNFVVLPSMATDERGLIWLANFATATNPIYSFNASAGGAIKKYGSSNLGGTREFPVGFNANIMAIDAFGRKWIGLQTTQGGAAGALVFSDGDTPDNLNDDFYLRINDGGSNGRLPNLGVTDLKSDRDGAMWIATEAGAAYFFDPSQIQAGFSIPSSTLVFDLRNESLTALAIDATNRKWFGSKSGVWLMNPDGSQVLAHYTAENSPLLSNNVLSVAFDDKTGIAYFGTDRGLSSLGTVAVEPRESLGALKIYPNPFIIPASQRLVIEGLTENASLKILSVSGALVRTIVSPGGGIIEWDGKDDQGRDVATGVYLAAIISSDKKSSTLGKIAVIRK